MVAGQLELKTCLSHPVATDLPGAKSEPAGANICDNATAWTGLHKEFVPCTESYGSGPSGPLRSPLIFML